MKRVIVHIQGGIGNQLFTYAMGYAYAKRNSCKLVLDNRDFFNGYKWPYVLNKLNITPTNECKSLFSSLFLRGFKRLCKNLYIREKKEFFYQDVDEVKLKNVIYLDGYWQSEKYFKDFRNEILNLYKLRNQEYINKIKELEILYDVENSVSVHIRRGDYVGGGRLVLDEYYDSAIKKIESLDKTKQYLVFSDDLEYVKQMKCFQGKNVTFFDSTIIHEDFVSILIMAKCKHHIITNSTFSWWAAWLDRKDSKIVIAPETEYLEKSDFYPEEWIKIKSKIR